MDWLLLAAGSGSAAAGFAHAVHGEMRFLPPYMESGTVADKDAPTSAAVLRLSWHVWALAYLAFAVMLVRFYLEDSLSDAGRWVVTAIAGCYAAASLLSFLFLKGRHVSAWLWLGLAALTYVGLV